MVIAVIFLFWIIALPGLWDVRGWGSLVPDKVSFTSGRQMCYDMAGLPLILILM